MDMTEIADAIETYFHTETTEEFVWSVRPAHHKQLPPPIDIARHWDGGRVFLLRVSFRDDSIGLSWGFEQTTFRLRRVWWYGKIATDYTCSSFSCHHEGSFATCPRTLVVSVGPRELISAVLCGIEDTLDCFSYPNAPQPVEALDIELLLNHIAGQWDAYSLKADLRLERRNDSGELVWFAGDAEVLKVFPSLIEGAWQIEEVILRPSIDFSMQPVMELPCQSTVHTFTGGRNPVACPHTLHEAYLDLWEEIETALLIIIAV